MENKPTLLPKGRFHPDFRGTECLNCGHLLAISDRYCPNCSQLNSTKKLSLKDFFDEFFSSLISYDSRLLKTLSAILLRPGRITKEYVEGKRVSYTIPFRFLLSVAIVYFLMMSVTGNFTELNKSWTESPYKINLKDNVRNLEFESEADKNEVLAAMDSIDYAIKKDPKIKFKDSLFGVDPSLYFKKLDSTNDVWKRYAGKVDFFNTTIKEDTLYIFKE